MEMNDAVGKESWEVFGRSKYPGDIHTGRSAGNYTLGRNSALAVFEGGDTRRCNICTVHSVANIASRQNRARAETQLTHRRKQKTKYIHTLSKLVKDEIAKTKRVGKQLKLIKETFKLLALYYTHSKHDYLLALQHKTMVFNGNTVAKRRW